MYVGWILAVVHSLATGSDTRNEMFLVLDVLAVGAVLAAFIGYRVAEAWPTLPPLWAALAAIALITTLGIGIWAANGPLQPGWARSSGTPSNLLHSRPGS
jgi:hypothetical protein